MEWTLSDVLEYLQVKNFPLLEAYTRYGSSRASSAFCVLASRRELAAATLCEDNHEVYRELVRLEAEPTFSFQDSFWLVDVAPDLLDTELREAVESARRRAKIRETAETDIPDHLLYESGWPRVIPTASEAELLCQVHRTVGGTLGRAVSYTEPHALIQRYLDLMRLRRNRKNWAANARPHGLNNGAPGPRRPFQRLLADNGVRPQTRPSFNSSPSLLQEVVKRSLGFVYIDVSLLVQIRTAIA